MGKLCYASQLKYVFRLEENVSSAVGQNSITPKGNNLNFRLSCDQVGFFKLSRQICAPVGVKQEMFHSFVLHTYIHTYIHFYFELGDMNKTQYSPLRALGKQNAPFALGPVIKVLINLLSCHVYRKFLRAQILNRAIP